MWVFYRAKHDLPVVLGLRHPWEHGEDPWAIVDHVENLHALEEDWEDFAIKSTNPGEVRAFRRGEGGGRISSESSWRSLSWILWFENSLL